MRQSFSNSPRRTPTRILRVAPRITYTDWAKAQTIINTLARKG